MAFVKSGAPGMAPPFGLAVAEAMAHGIPYVATATVADLHDLEDKVTRAMEIHGARYIHILVTCPLGWGSAPSVTVKVARLATQTLPRHPAPRPMNCRLFMQNPPLEV